MCLKRFKGILTMVSSNKNIVNIPQVQEGFQGEGRQHFSFKLIHKDVGIAGCHFGTHRSTFDLQVMFVVKGEKTMGKNEFDDMGQVFGILFPSVII